MANDDKFSKTLDDEELEEVAGGTIEELQKDLKFFKAIGLIQNQNLNPNFKDMRNVKAMKAVWAKLGIKQDNWLDDKESDCHVNEKTRYTDIETSVFLTRQDAMIYAMRKQNRYANLEDFI